MPILPKNKVRYKNNPYPSFSKHLEEKVKRGDVRLFGSIQGETLNKDSYVDMSKYMLNMVKNGLPGGGSDWRVDFTLGGPNSIGLEFHGITVGRQIGDGAEVYLSGVEYVEAAGGYAVRTDYTLFSPPFYKYFYEASENLGSYMAALEGGFAGIPFVQQTFIQQLPGSTEISSLDLLDSTSIVVGARTIASNGIPEFADDADAGANGLVTGDWFIHATTKALTVKT